MACATICSVQQHFLPLKLWTSFFPIFMWDWNNSSSVRLNSSVLIFPFFMNVPVCISSWVFMALGQLLSTLHVALQSLWIFISLPDSIKCLDCDLGQCVCVCFSSASWWYQMYFSASLVAVHPIPSFFFLALSNCTSDQDLNFHPLCKP